MPQSILSSRYVTVHYVNEIYHRNHSQLIHTHPDQLELLYFSKGSGNYFVNNHSYSVGEGNLVICNANVSHGELPFSNHLLESYCCVLQDVHVPGLPANTLTDPSRSPVLFFSGEETLFSHLIIALYELESGSDLPSGYKESVSNALLNLVLEKLRARANGEAVSGNTLEELITDVLDYIEQNYTKTISLNDLSAEFHFSTSYLSHLFKDEFGIAPMKYIMQRRIGEAQKLLMNTDSKLAVISDMLGFNDTSHFSSSFRKYTGLTPSAYRNHFKNQ